MSQQSERLYQHLLSLTWQFNSICCNGDSCEDFTLIDLMAMGIIQSESNCPIQTIGKRLGITKSGSTRVVKRLEKRGLVAIGTHPDDARIRCLCLTEQGSECLDAVQKKQSQRIARSLGELDEQTICQLEQGLKVLLEQMPDKETCP